MAIIQVSLYKLAVKRYFVYLIQFVYMSSETASSPFGLEESYFGIATFTIFTVVVFITHVAVTVTCIACDWCCSMGGHGALICHLKNPGMYQCVSALAPICNPTQCPWGHKAFEGYLGSDQTSWAVRISVAIFTNH